MTYPLNPFAPMYQQGLETPDPQLVGYQDKMHEYAINITFPTGSGAAPYALIEELINLDRDADFYLCSWWESLGDGQDSSESAFMIQLNDSLGNEITSGSVCSSTISQAASDQTVLSPAHRFAKGTQIHIQAQNVLGEGGLTIQLVFRGIKRFVWGGY